MSFTPFPNAGKPPDMVGYFLQYDQTPEARLLGRGAGNGLGPLDYLTLGPGLALSGTVLSALGLGGDVAGPISSSDNFVALWDGVTGKLLKDSAINGAWFDQDVSTGASPSFADLSVSGFPFTVTGPPTLDDWFDQSVKTTSGPTFNEVLLTTRIVIPNAGLQVLDTNATHTLNIVPGSNLTADRILSLVTGDAARTVTFTGNPTLDDWFDQPVKAASTPQFARVGIGQAASGTSVLAVTGLPTSSAGLATGDVWSNGGILSIV